MKIRKGLLAACIAVPLAVGGLSALITRESMKVFETLAKPPLSPPGWLFPVAWTILYILMGIASYIVITSGKPQAVTDRALWLYGLQLVFNFFWPIFFFSLSMYLFAFIWLLVLWILILLTALAFYRIRPAAGYLLIPYLLWVAFAGYLNIGIFILNR
ncbi:MAG: tryptophan-rich sensory protein [Clostridiales bacterium]|nr:tryptophan-rich sensory protein [Clostridiales bacterium]